jgi:hypothetical protein
MARRACGNARHWCISVGTMKMVGIRRLEQGRTGFLQGGALSDLRALRCPMQITARVARLTNN